MFELIDLENFQRREHFEHFTKSVPCTYSMCVKLDITEIKNRGQKLYPAMLYFITSAVNRHRAFRMAFDGEGRLGVFDSMLPCYTVFHKDTEAFSNIWTEYSEDYDVFLKNYNEDISLYGGCHDMDAKPNVPENNFPVSMIPWSSFDGFNLNLQRGYGYLIPIFTMGRYYEENGRYLMPLSVQVHHAVCDGFHLCRFLDDLQRLIDGE